MIVIKIKEKENIDKALKQFKRKFNEIGVVKELREREHFTKPSMKRRNVVKKAIYVQKIKESENTNT
jgi:small subunit ribosomal protein S21